PDLDRRRSAAAPARVRARDGRPRPVALALAGERGRVPRRRRRPPAGGRGAGRLLRLAARHPRQARAHPHRPPAPGGPPMAEVAGTELSTISRSLEATRHELALAAADLESA